MRMIYYQLPPFFLIGGGRVEMLGENGYTNTDVTVRKNSSPLSLFMGALPQVKSQQDLIMVAFP